MVHKATLTEKNLLLRGSVLRATEWAVGVVVYSGKDTKLSLNSKSTPSKLSSVDRIVNRTLMVAIGMCMPGTVAMCVFTAALLLYMVGVMIAVCFLSMGMGIMWETYNNNAYYLCLQKNDMDDRYPAGRYYWSGIVHLLYLHVLCCT